jgi:3-deoxy-D-manno-octulosonic-acid transferase
VRHLYTLILYVFLPFVVLRMLLRSLRAPAYRQRLAERFGFFKPRSELSMPAIWVHAVSVGEVAAVQPLVEKLQQRYPNHPIVLTTTTPTGSARVQELFSDRVFHVYLPWDLPAVLARFFERTRPCLLLLVETELWPNLVAACAHNDCAAMVINARLSAQSARRYSRIKPLVNEMLGSLDQVVCQSPEDRDRFERLGAQPLSLRVAGNLKADFELTAVMREQAQRLRDSMDADNRLLIVAGSTHQGEEQIMLDAYAEIRGSVSHCLLAIAPRHPERFDSIVELCESRGLRVVTRSSGSVPGHDDDVLLIDSLGELPLFYGVASVAVIGGSFVPRGGHNVLEAAAWGIPALSGPSVYNFSSVYTTLTQEQGVLVLKSPARLGPLIKALLEDPARRRTMGLANLKVVEENRGACEATLELIAGRLNA